MKIKKRKSNNNEFILYQSQASYFSFTNFGVRGFPQLFSVSGSRPDSHKSKVVKVSVSFSNSSFVHLKAFTPLMQSKLCKRNSSNEHSRVFDHYERVLLFSRIFESFQLFCHFSYAMTHFYFKSSVWLFKSAYVFSDFTKFSLNCS